MSNKLRETLNLPPEEDIVEEYEDLNLNDIDYVKGNIKELLDSGKVSLKVLTEFAKSSESPRAFEALSTLIKTLLEANKEYHSITKPKDSDENNNNRLDNDRPKMISFDPSILENQDDE